MTARKLENGEASTEHSPSSTYASEVTRLRTSCSQNQQYPSTPENSTLPQHCQNESVSTSLPVLVDDDSSPPCDACPYCADVCSNVNCKICIRKSLVIREREGRRTRSRKSQVASNPTNPFFRTLSNTSSIAANSNANALKQDIFITPCQLKRHNNSSSAWLLCGDVVYDATDYIKIHPGGRNSILRKSGGVTDCTRDMSFHSSRAVKTWKQFRVGVLGTCPGEYDENSDLDDNSSNEQCVIS
jgi:cytochrome b involved in lipid metabolism